MLVSWWVPKAFDRMGGSSLTSSFSGPAFQEILLVPSILTLYLSLFFLYSLSLFSSPLSIRLYDPQCGSR